MAMWQAVAHLEVHEGDPCLIRCPSQMTGGDKGVVLGRCNPLTLRPDLEWLAQELQKPDPPKMVVSPQNDMTMNLL